MHDSGHPLDPTSYPQSFQVACPQGEIDLEQGMTIMVFVQQALFEHLLVEAADPLCMEVGSRRDPRGGIKFTPPVVEAGCEEGSTIRDAFTAAYLLE